MDTKTYERFGLHKTFVESHGDMNAKVNGRSNLEAVEVLETPADAQYQPCPQAFPQADTPRGHVTSLKDWSESKSYPETQRDIWIYVPQQFDPAADAAGFFLFNDGAIYLDPDGAVRAAAVLDTLIHRGNLAPVIGIFLMPGRPLDVPAPREGERMGPRAIEQRGYEYDSMHDKFAEFLAGEILPLTESHIGAKLSRVPTDNLICGISSGGICAFTAAWNRPDLFGRVLSHCGSFTAMRGGHNYPFLIRSTPRKPLRVMLTSGGHDLDIIFGNWPLANRAVAAALEFAGYDYRFEFGQGGHSLFHGGALFADSLRWLFRDN